MAYQANRFDRRDAISLIVALLSVAAIIYYQIFWRGYSSYTFDLTADMIYRLFVLPMAFVSIPFFLSSRFFAIRFSTASLHILKVVCLGLSIAYLFCIVMLMLIVSPSMHEIRSAVWRYIDIFVPYFAIVVGAVLGIRNKSV